MKKLFFCLFILVAGVMSACQSDSDGKASVGLLKLSEQQRLIMDQFYSIFEYGRTTPGYEKAKNIQDGRGITAGKVGFTSGTGDLLMVIERYTQMKPNNSLAQYIAELKRIDQLYKESGYNIENCPKCAAVDNLLGLEKNWKENAKVQVFKDVQDEIDNKINLKPVKEKAQSLGLISALSILSLYDANIQHGESGLENLINGATQISQGLTPKQGAKELVWLKHFNQNRKKVLLENHNWRDSVHRAIELLDLIDAENTELKPFELRIEYKYTEHPDWDDDVYQLPDLGLAKIKILPLSTIHWQLQGTVNPDYKVTIYDIDLFDSSTSLIKKLKADDKKVICYFSAGSYESWRSDATKFKAGDLGKPLDGWQGESWLDIRSNNVRNIMLSRLDLAKQKGCDGVEPDNMDGYINESGFALTATEQLSFNRFIANKAHSRGLLVGLKNAMDQVQQLVDYFDFSMNEQCHEFNECDTLMPFIEQGKAVFNVEYKNSYVIDKKVKDTLCLDAKRRKFTSLVLPKLLDDSFRFSCLK